MRRAKSLPRIAVMAASAVCLSGVALAQGISVILNGNPIVFHGTGPQQVNGRVLVPLRGVLEQMGAFVDWQPAGQLVTAQQGSTNIQLRIGDRVAHVNDRYVNLDVPAMIYHGNTMVPLRFMSEALGADVRWEPSQYAVLITTGNSGQAAQPYTPPEQYDNRPTPAAQISSLDLDRSGWVRPGMDIHFTMRGTPGGTASLQIPGLSRDVPMTETSPGVYEATWTVPESWSQTSRRNVTATARLRVNGVERTLVSNEAFGIETQLPTIRAVTPNDQARVTVGRPTISATFDNSTGSGIDPASVRVIVDGRDVTSDADITANNVSYTPYASLGTGVHNVTIRATDLNGNVIRKDWSFRVDAQGNRVVRSFNVSGADNARPGDVLRFTLVATPGGRATFSIGDILTDRQMQETSPGRYVANYTVRRGDDLVNQPITARFVTPNGDVYAVNALDTLDMGDAPLQPPVITTPRATDRIQDPLVVEGRTAPNARVLIHVDYSTDVAGAVRLNGAVGEVTAVADQDGYFRTDPIRLNTLVKGRNTQYTIRAFTLGSGDRRSDETTVRVNP